MSSSLDNKQTSQVSQVTKITPSDPTLSKIHFADLASAKEAHKSNKAKKANAQNQDTNAILGVRKTKARPAIDIVQVSLDDSAFNLKVPYYKLKLSNQEEIMRYGVDTSLKVSATSIEETSDTQKARPKLNLVRAPFINSYLPKLKGKTQLECAREGFITPEMEYVAIRESANHLERLEDSCKMGAVRFNSSGEIASLNDKSLVLRKSQLAFTPEYVRAQVASGCAVIPCNARHLECEPMIIGKNFYTKVNANIGASAISSTFEEEIDKLYLALQFGADTVMDLSTGLSNLGELRSAIVHSSPVPIGTVPIYEALDRVGGDANLLNWEVFKEVIIDQAKQGVDYFTIHAGLKQELLPFAAERLMGIVSRGGAIMASHMMMHECENMAFAHFDELMDICAEYDVALSLGDGLRPGAVYDACDRAQYGELKAIGELAKRCFKRGVQCFIEGPGHVPLDKVEENQKLEEEYCNNAPFYTLGPLVTDAGAGFDHITSAIGATNIAMHGTAMLCYVTPAEHLSLPTAEDVKQGLITYKIAAHAADVAKHLTNAIRLDHAMSRARATFRWFDQFALSFDEQHAYEVWKAQMDEEDCEHDVSFCSMCGPRFCPIRLNRRLHAKFIKN